MTVGPVLTKLARCVCVVMRTETRRILVHYSVQSGRWTLPWGDVGPDEEPLAAAIRVFRDYSDLGLREAALKFRLTLGKRADLLTGAEMFVYEADRENAVGELQDRTSGGNAPTSYVNYLTPAELRHCFERGHMAEIWYDHLVRWLVTEALMSS